MPQYARPSSIISLGGWACPSHELLNGAIPGDAAIVMSPASPSNATLLLALSSVTDPLTSGGHVVRYRYQKAESGGAQIDLTVRLLQGVTEIASWSHTNIAAGWLTIAQTLTGVQADAITNYADLRLEFKANKV